MQILHSHSGLNTLISLKLEGSGDTRVLVKDFQLDPVTHKLLHVDFYRVAMDKRCALVGGQLLGRDAVLGLVTDKVTLSRSTLIFTARVFSEAMVETGRRPREALRVELQELVVPVGITRL